MPPSIADVVTHLERCCSEVWLIGSRANPSGKPPQDWDVLAFGDRQLLKEFERRQRIVDLDLLIVYNGDDFRSPWRRSADRAIKTGSLTSWEWNRIDDMHATYRATKPRADDDFAVEIATKTAIRLTTVKAR